MKTKQDLLDKMTELKVCGEAVDYVAEHPSDDAAEIWAGCDRVDWMCWFAFRLVPVGAFAFGCADRAVRVYVPSALRVAGLTAEAERLASLPPIVDARSAATAYAATDSSNVARAAARGAYDATYNHHAAAYAAYAAAAAYASAAHAAGDAAYDAERDEQLKHLHALWSSISEK